MLGLALSICNPILGGSGTPVDHYDYEWTETAVDPGWIPTDGRMVEYYDGAWWTTGGWSSEDGGPFTGPVNTTNEVWTSTNLTSWTEALPFDDDPPTSGAGARFKRRHYHGFLTHSHGGTSYLYVLGGDHESDGDADFDGSGGYQQDIWRTTTPGGDWERVMASGDAPWSDRMLNIWGSSGTALWMFGGTDIILGGSNEGFNDLWTSTDGGATWSEVPITNAPPIRCAVQKLVLWGGRMWLVGGGTYDDDLALRTYYRDVWSFDPASPTAWTQHANPPWVGTMYNGVAVFNGRLWTFGGAADPNGANTNVVFSTGDGEVWRREDRPTWPHTHADGVAVDGATLVVISGNGAIALDESTVHSLTYTAVEEAVEVTAPRAVAVVADAVLSGSNVTSITDPNGTGYTFVPNVAGDATYTAEDDDFGGAASATTNGGHFLHSSGTSSGNINQAGFTIFLVGKVTDITSGFLYYVYSTVTGQNYTYYGTNRNASLAHRSTMQFDVRRAAVSTTGTENSAYDQDDIRHIWVFHFDGTNEGSFMRQDGAQVLPDNSTVTGDSGTGAYTIPLYIFSDNGGTGSKAAKMTEVRVYPTLTLAQIRQVERELEALYPYKPPT